MSPAVGQEGGVRTSNAAVAAVGLQPGNLCHIEGLVVHRVEAFMLLLLQLNLLITSRFGVEVGLLWVVIGCIHHVQCGINSRQAKIKYKLK